MTPATYDHPGFTRGDTFLAWMVTRLAYAAVDPDPETPIPLASARVQVRSSAGVLVHEWTTEDGSATITGDDDNVLTLTSVDAETTATWAVGIHRYEVEVTLAGGEVWTVLRGAFPVEKDTTR